MKKILLIGLVVVGIGVAGVVALAFFLGQAITAGVNKFGPAITQTKVTLASARVSPIDGIGTLKGLVIGNPKGWSENNLCALGEIHIKMEPMSVFGDRIVIHEIRIDGPEFNYETKIVASNVSDLLKAIEATTGSPKPGAEQPMTNAGKPIKFEVRKFTLSNAVARVGGLGQGMTVQMPPIELNDLGTKEGGITPAEMVQAVMRSVTTSVVAATMKGAGDLNLTSGAAAAESLKKAGESIKGMFGGQKK